MTRAIITVVGKDTVGITDISTELAQVGEGLGVIVKCQLEDIFDKMHRI